MTAPAFLSKTGLSNIYVREGQDHSKKINLCMNPEGGGGEGEGRVMREFIKYCFYKNK